MDKPQDLARATMPGESPRSALWRETFALRLRSGLFSHDFATAISDAATAGDGAVAAYDKAFPETAPVAVQTAAPALTITRAAKAPKPKE